MQQMTSTELQALIGQAHGLMSQRRQEEAAQAVECRALIAQSTLQPRWKRDPRLLQWSTDHLPPHPPRRVSEFALCILIMWFVYGGTLVAAGFTDEWSPTPALRAVPSWLELALGVSIQLGTALVVIGVVPQHKMASQ